VKQAFTAYMHATQGPYRAALLIEGENDRAYISHGYAYQRLAWARPRSLAEVGEGEGGSSSGAPVVGHIKAPPAAHDTVSVTPYG
jgi:hypothetical protein